MEDNTTPLVENGSDNTNHDENHVKETKNTSDVMEAHQLLAQGKRNMVCGEVHHAVTQFQQACELLGKKYGELADECAEAYFYYGRALLEFARSDNGVLGNAMDSVSSEEDANSVSDDEAPAPAEGEQTANGATEDADADGNEAAAQEEDETSVASEDNSVELEDEEGDGATTSAAAGADGDENKENIEQPEEDVSNLQLAWEMLEVAKVIFTRHETKEAKLKLSEIYLNLGEIGLESGQFSQAIDDFRACLHLRQELLEADDRCLAETFYQLGLACTYNANYDDALNYYKQAIDVINSKLKSLQQLVSEGEAAGKGPDFADFDDPVYKARREIEDLQSILPDIAGKMEDTQDEKKNAELVKRMMRETMALPPPSDGGCSSKSLASASGSAASSQDSQSKEPTNITHLVRKKRKPEEAAGDSSSSKKVAVENGDTTARNGDSNAAPNGN